MTSVELAGDHVHGLGVAEPARGHVGGPGSCPRMVRKENFLVISDS